MPRTPAPELPPELRRTPLFVVNRVATIAPLVGVLLLLYALLGGPSSRGAWLAAGALILVAGVVVGATTMVALNIRAGRLEVRDGQIRMVEDRDA